MADRKGPQVRPPFPVYDQLQPLSDGAAAAVVRGVVLDFHQQPRRQTAVGAQPSLEAVSRPVTPVGVTVGPVQTQAQDTEIGLKALGQHHGGVAQMVARAAGVRGGFQVRGGDVQAQPAGARQGHGEGGQKQGPRRAHNGAVAPAAVAVARHYLAADALDRAAALPAVVVLAAQSGQAPLAPVVEVVALDEAVAQGTVIDPRRVPVGFLVVRVLGVGVNGVVAVGRMRASEQESLRRHLGQRQMRVPVLRSGAGAASGDRARNSSGHRPRAGDLGLSCRWGLEQPVPGIGKTDQGAHEERHTSKFSASRKRASNSMPSLLTPTMV